QVLQHAVRPRPFAAGAPRRLQPLRLPDRADGRRRGPRAVPGDALHDGQAVRFPRHRPDARAGRLSRGAQLALTGDSTAAVAVRPMTPIKTRRNYEPATRI